MNDAYTSTIRSLVTALEYRDQETKGHCERVTEMATTLGRALNLSEIEIDDLRRGALLHDIGKIAVPDTILLKPGALTPEERKMMETHAEIGYEMLREIRFLERALDIPRFHHEKWDGTGYPHGVEGNDIPLAARIFSLVDVWDALSSTRPYRKAWPPEQVKEHILKLAGSHFDPTVVAAFESLPLDQFPSEFRPDASHDAAA
ncbi:HD domain-containing protein [bacterium]|nr:MAG: HD domain-containing protein [bacterium]